MKRVKILECKVDGETVEVKPSGEIVKFKPKMRVEVIATSLLQTALVVNRNSAGKYVLRRINKGGEFVLKAGAGMYQFLWPHNLVQFVWLYHGRVKVMSLAVVRYNNYVRFVEEMLLEASVQQEAGVITIKGGRAWQDLFRLAQQHDLLPAGQFFTTYPPRPIAPIDEGEGSVDWYNCAMNGRVNENGIGGNGFGHAIVRLNGQEFVTNLVAGNFIDGPPLGGLKRGDLITFDKVVPQLRDFGRNPYLTGVRVVNS